MANYQNDLINASSPYLLQHADNPVDWKEWSEEVLEQARKENKLILISIGYSACHWCHVMEKECFSDPEVAQLMNDNFINIKVDREERPDVDQIYMDALQLMTGQGGWPLNVIALPDQRPVFGGTYFPKPQWKELLEKISSMYQQQSESFEQYAGKLVRALQGMNDPQSLDSKQEVRPEQLQQLFDKILQSTDDQYGGVGSAPKFPLPSVWNGLLYYYILSGEEQALERTLITLDKMAEGGIYDQIGGGFARYSTDEKWIVPHFEKMLYDNGQLLELYANAYRLTQREKYASILRETKDFINREMTGDHGEFFSSLDADSEGEEGKYYVWEVGDFRRASGDDAIWAEKYYGVGGQGLWENGRNILIRARSDEDMAKEMGMKEEDFLKRLENVKQRLFQEREKRVRPALDDKVLTSWNALTISGLVNSYKALGDEDFLEMAKKNASFIRENMVKEGKLQHNYHKGKAKISGFLEDYAFWIKALCDLYEVTFEEGYLTEARSWSQEVLNRFMDNQSGFFYFTPTDESALIARKKELPDNVIPSSNSTMAYNLIRLGHWFALDELKEQADLMIKMIKPQALKTPTFHGMWSVAMAMRSAPFYELAISGNDAQNEALEFEKNFVPIKLLGVAPENGSTELPFLKGKGGEKETTFYLCEDKVCNQPVNTRQELMDMIRHTLKNWQENNFVNSEG